jgi:hypothetical protein
MRRSFTAWSLASALALTLAANAADPLKLDVKLGLWEMTSTGKISGQLPIPEDQLAKLPPEQRDKIMASLGATSVPVTTQSCMTADKVAEGFTPREFHGNCQNQVVSNTGSELTMTGTCTNDRGTQSFTIHIKRLSREEAAGDISVVASRGGRTMNLERTIKAKWLGASCGKVQ